jgi:hypothetical protein
MESSPMLCKQAYGMEDSERMEQSTPSSRHSGESACLVSRWSADDYFR